MRDEPFWEEAYGDLDSPSAFGAPSTEVIELAHLLPEKARVLDLGCGDGRNALYLAERGFQIKAIDSSSRAIQKLDHTAHERALVVDTVVQDIRDWVIEIRENFDLVLAHGCLHLIEPHHSCHVIEQMKTATKIGGYNVIAVFTDAIEPPDDLRPFIRGLFTDREIFSHYSDWQITQSYSYIFEDEHPGGIRHRHAVDKVVARKRH
jgi:tellurite methyltransferase